MFCWAGRGGDSGSDMVDVTVVYSADAFEWPDYIVQHLGQGRVKLILRTLRDTDLLKDQSCSGSAMLIIWVTV